MKSLLSVSLALTFLCLAGAANAQQTAADSAQVANPVSSTVKSQMARFAKNMVAAAEAMPAEKFDFKPSPEMNAYGHLVLHILQTNNLLCSKISAAAVPDVRLADTDSKEKLVAALKASFDYCSAALANIDDSKLGDPLVLFGNRPSNRAGALIALSDGWYDHYSTQAIYLRLNGILPPSAQPANPAPAKQ
jgi:hypothetical protein